jgi:putative ATPase
MKLIEKDQMPSLILWGPPGCGKTTFALILAQKTQREFISVNAVDTGAKALKELGQQARERRQQYRKNTVLFIDEIHRLNKAQQDVLLPFVERGDLTLVGATTENPSFEVNPALLSRCRLVVFERLAAEALRDLLEKACSHYKVRAKELLQDEAIEALTELSDGDGRRLISFAEQVGNAYTSEYKNKTSWPLSSTDLKEIIGSVPLYFSKDRDEHYDTISAFIKSIRGSDPGAGLYYLARMLDGGEDPVFIARRLVILASEDVSNADPKALPLAVAGMQAVQMIGLPEAAINLAQVVTYLASAPKSNRSYIGLKRAQKEVKESKSLPIPKSVRNAPTKMMKELGYGKDYNYAHDGAKGWLPQQFLPDQIKDKSFYEPSDHGFEKKIKEYLEWLRK